MDVNLLLLINNYDRVLHDYLIISQGMPELIKFYVVVSIISRLLGRNIFKICELAISFDHFLHTAYEIISDSYFHYDISLVIKYSHYRSASKSIT